MTERKPMRATFESWIDTQIRDAYERGEFDGLAGAGKPIPVRAGDDWWVRGYLEREGLSADDLLPEPLRLRKDIERLPAAVREMRTEREVRDEVARLNGRIGAWLRNPSGPQIPIGRVDPDDVVEQWRSHRAAAAPGGPDRPAPDEEQRRIRRALARAALAEAGFPEIRRGEVRFERRSRRRFRWPLRRRASRDGQPSTLP